MVSMRQEVTHIRKEHERHARRAGETIVWFELIPFGPDELTQSKWGRLYDEAPEGVGGRRYKAGVPVNVFWVIENEDERRAQPEGNQNTQTITFSVGYQQLLERGITEPHESTRHTGDVVYFDGRYYQIYLYKNRGRLQDDIGVSVRANEVFLDQDFVNDPGPALPSVSNLPWPATLPEAP
jgi:hypothetical protein